jgi:predicted membrane protein
LGTDWHIHLNPKVQSDIAAHSGGGNVKLNLTGMAVTCVSADTGGGNMDVVLPDEAADLSVTATTGAGRIALAIGSHITGCNIIHAKSGAGNVTVQVPSSIAARIYVSNGMGKTTVDPRFNKIDGNTYQSPEYDGASDKVQITVKSGAGAVRIDTR